MTTPASDPGEGRRGPRGDSAPRRPRPSLAALAGLAVATVVVGLGVGAAGSGPLIGVADVNQFEHIGLLVAEGWRWTPLPHLELVTDRLFYPYGTSAVYQVWGLERDLLYAACLRSFGHGPWLRLYYLGSLAVGFFGVYLLLCRDFGHGRATLASVLATGFGFYALFKFPHHLNIAALHWMTLGFVADFLVFHRLASRRLLSVRLLLVRACLAVLALGLDLAYVATFSLLSLGVTSAMALGLVAWRRARSPESPWPAVSGSLRSPSALALLAVLVAASWLYLPAIAGIAREAAALAAGAPEDERPVLLAASPLRLLLPYLPGLDPATPRHLGFGVLGLYLDDHPEGLGAGAVGWTLLAAALLGLWGWRRQPLVFAPLLVLFVVLVVHRPEIPVLQLLPWARFTRVASRTTVALPVLCALMSLGIPWPRLRPRARLAAALLLGGLGSVELGVAWSLAPRLPRFEPDPAFWRLMAATRALPGEAVLDWPFCVVGGNSVGLAELCPAWGRGQNVGTYRRFHGKKVVGHYFGRLRRAQIEPFLRDGWPSLLSTVATGRCFSDADWARFDDLLAEGDYGGILLYVDLLPAGCGEGFHERFGAATARARLPDAGTVELLPLSRRHAEAGEALAAGR